MRRLQYLAALFLAVMLSFSAHAEQFKEFEDHVVHYVAFNSMSVSKKVLNSYGFQRAPNRVLINVSVQRKDKKPDEWGIAADVTGSATNLNDQRQTLKFKQIKEGNAIYYLASIRVANQEQFRFNIDIAPSDKKQTLSIKFEEKFFVDY